MRTYEKKTFPRTTRNLAEMLEKGTITFENSVQRNYVWKNTEKDNRQSMLIDSILRGFPIPAMYCNCVTSGEKKIYSFLDGKQRGITIIRFTKDEFALVGIPTFEDEDGNEVDLNGKKFSELPEKFQEVIKTFTFNVFYFEDMSDDDVEEMFARLNNGKPLSQIELTRVHSKSFDTIREIGQHEIFNEMLTETTRAGYGNEDIVIKTWIMLYADNPILDTKDVRPIMKETEITAEQKAEIEAVLNKVKEVHDNIHNVVEDKKLADKIAKRIYTKTHLLSIVPFIQMAIYEERELDDITNWLVKFFNGGKKCAISEDYVNHCSSGSGHAISVKIRNKALLDSYVDFFGEIDTKEETATDVEVKEEAPAEVETESEEILVEEVIDTETEVSEEVATEIVAEEEVNDELTEETVA